uniref:Uncharacterized protein n=1 Tax=Leersia perrieri TaxID=77586 RepID=A0A0D9V5A0_9ORYZ
MEGEEEEILASIDSLWFYSSVFLPPSSKQQECFPPPGLGELQPGEQDSTEILKTDGDCGHQDAGCIRESTPVVAGRRSGAAAARIREVEEERMDIWQEQCRQVRVAAVRARCSPLPMPHTSDGPAMRAHLRSWAIAVACSVR